MVIPREYFKTVYRKVNIFFNLDMSLKVNYIHKSWWSHSRLLKNAGSTISPPRLASNKTAVFLYVSFGHIRNKSKSRKLNQVLGVLFKFHGLTANILVGQLFCLK